MEKFKHVVVSPDKYDPIEVEVDIPKNLVDRVQETLDDFEDQYNVIRFTNPDENIILFAMMDNDSPNTGYSVEIKPLKKK